MTPTLDIAALAKLHRLSLTADGQAIDFFGGRLVAFGSMLAFVSTTRPTSEEAGQIIRVKAETIHWDAELGHLTAVIHPRNLHALIIAIRAAELGAIQ